VEQALAGFNSSVVFSRGFSSVAVKVGLLADPHHLLMRFRFWIHIFALMLIRIRIQLSTLMRGSGSAPNC
jgi:hypothetical protein